MTNRQLVATCLMFAHISISGLAALEQNMWPFWVTRYDTTGQVTETQAIGPLFFKENTPTESFSGFRPLVYRHKNIPVQEHETALLYPIFRYQEDPVSSSWSVFNLINSTSSNLEGDPHSGFDIWPVYFSRETGDPETSYRGLFPIGGSIKNRLGYDELSWVLFPLYWESTRHGVVTRSTPWPIIKNSSGGGHEGFTFWPLFGHAEKPGEYQRAFWLWPIFFHNREKLSTPEPSEFNAVFPLYTSSQRPGRTDTNFLLLFGRTDQVTPVAYQERRYLWPLLVQGRGPKNYTNRWAPIYTHSIRRGYDKTWVVWPLWRQASWAEPPLQRDRQQFFWFIYWNETQHDPRRPEAAVARKTHLWPLLSSWDNGAGSKQAQFPSLLAVFFPHNERVQKIYSPLFALYRYDQKSPDHIRRSLLWNAITWRKTAHEREFHLGPLYSAEQTPDGQRIALLNGVISFRRSPKTDQWTLSLFDFSPLKSIDSPLHDAR